MKIQSGIICPRCGIGRLRVWSELSVEEQMIVRRLPASADFDLQERIRVHSWCTHCWHESFQRESRDA
ncbi:MAG: hypothetical protein ACR2LC_06720 [Pyrinomonadaceae bacterium]